MLVRVDPGEKAVTLLSFPRDLLVSHPGCEGYPPWTGRINEAYVYCGPRGTLSTVKELTGIPINYMITVNFRAFRRIVDSVDGVYMDVDRRYFNDNSQADTYESLDLKPGYQLLDGEDALDFVRYRHTDSDLYRRRPPAGVREGPEAARLERLGHLRVARHRPGGYGEHRGGQGRRQADQLGRGPSHAQALYSLPEGTSSRCPSKASGLLRARGLRELAPGCDPPLHDPDVKASDRAITVATGRSRRGRRDRRPPR